MKKIGFLGIRQKGREGARENTGNFLHGFAARHIIHNFDEVWNYDPSDETVSDVREKFDHLVFVAATTVNVNKPSPLAENQLRMAEFLRRANLPVTVLGLGAQTRLGLSVSDAKVYPETIRMLEVMSTLGPSIAVRGEYTADLLRKYGILNVDVVGCQSTFLNCDPDFRFPKLTMDPGRARKMLSATRVGPELTLVAKAMSEGWGVIGQSSHFEYNLKSVDVGVPFDDLPEDLQKIADPSLVRKIKDGAIYFQEYHAWVRDHFQQFYSMPPWFEYIRRNFDLAIGTRFHGNMTAMHSGIPAVWVIHDSRTKEFCEYLGLPSILLSEITEADKLPDQMEQALADACFDRLYPVNYRRLYDYLESHGLDHAMQPPTEMA